MNKSKQNCFVYSHRMATSTKCRQTQKIIHLLNVRKKQQFYLILSILRRRIFCVIRIVLAENRCTHVSAITKPLFLFIFFYLLHPITQHFDIKEIRIMRDWSKHFQSLIMMFTSRSELNSTFNEIQLSLSKI